MKSLFLATLTKTINTYLTLDPESKPRLQKLQGKTITIVLLPFHFTFQCVFKNQQVYIQMEDLIAADTTIRGTPLQMLGVMLTKENRHVFFAEDLVIEGDAELGQQMIALFDELQIDWEEHLSNIVGDIPAYHVGQFLGGVNKWLRRADKTFSDDINEYLHEETACLPAHEALQDFFADIDTLRMDTDRLETRIQRLRALLSDREENL